MNNLFGRFSFRNAKDPNPGSWDRSAAAIRNAVCPTRRRQYVHFQSEFHQRVPLRLYSLERQHVSVADKQSAPFAQQVGVAMFPFPVLGFPSMSFSPTGQISGQPRLTAGLVGAAATSTLRIFSMGG